MRSSILVTLVALPLLSAPALAEDPKEAKPGAEKIRIANQHPFDVAACFQKPVELAGIPDQAAFSMALTLAQPRALECLTEDATRGLAPTTEVRVDATIDDKGVTFAAAGDNLKPPGAECIVKALAETIKVAPLEAGAKPVTLSAELLHDGSVHAAVKLGINEPSDWVGAVRSGMNDWCGCYEAYHDKRPPVLTAEVTLVNGTSQIAFRKSATPESDAVAQCLQPKLAALPVAKSDNQYRFAMKLVHLHSYDRAKPTDLGPELSFQQSELARLQLFAHAEMALSERTDTAKSFDAAVATYQKAPSVKLFGGLVSRCQKLEKSDAKWLDAAKTLLAHEENMAATTSALAAKDASWKAAADLIEQSRAKTDKEVAVATQTQSQDKANCAKLK